MYMKVDFADYKPWSGAVSTYEAIIEKVGIDALENFLTEVFFDEIPTDTQINDLLWFDSEYVYESLGIRSYHGIEQEIQELKDQVSELEEEINSIKFDLEDELETADTETEKTELKKEADEEMKDLLDQIKELETQIEELKEEQEDAPE